MQLNITYNSVVTAMKYIDKNGVQFEGVRKAFVFLVQTAVRNTP